MRVSKIFVFFIVIIICVAVFFLWIPSQYVVPILMYHELIEKDPPEANYTSPDIFNRHMTFLKEHHYNVISLDDLVSAIEDEKVLPRNSVVITFDDGYLSNYQHAFPILRKYRFPALIFVPTDKVGSKGRLTWEQIKEMNAQGISFGSHGRREAYLPKSTNEELQTEIYGSKAVFLAKAGIRVRHYCYPLGGFSDKIKDLIQQAGYKSACTTNRGSDRYNRDVYQLNRIRMSDKDNSDFILRAKLSGYYNMFRKLKNPY